MHQTAERKQDNACTVQARFEEALPVDRKHIGTYARRSI